MINQSNLKECSAVGGTKFFSHSLVTFAILTLASIPV
jgi:hypothetical protein